MYSDRVNIVWNSLVDSVDLVNIDYLNIDIRSVPTANQANASAHAANDVQFFSQQATLLNLAQSPTADTCPYFDAATLTGSYTSTMDNITQDFSEVYSDAAFACPSCQATPQGSSPARVYFNGTMWIPRYLKSSEVYCTSIQCFTYPYGFINYRADTLNATVEYLPSDTCPSGVEYLTKSSLISQDETLQALTFSNLLTNSLLDPWLGTYSIQGGYSPYGVLDFDAQAISQAQAFWMVLIGMMLMNGFWPMAGEQ